MEETFACIRAIEPVAYYRWCFGIDVGLAGPTMACPRKREGRLNHHLCGLWIAQFSTDTTQHALKTSGVAEGPTPGTLGGVGSTTRQGEGKWRCRAPLQTAHDGTTQNVSVFDRILLSFQFWPMPSMSRGVINCAKLLLSHPFSRIKSFDQWAVDRDPFLTSTTSAKIGKTARRSGKRVGKRILPSSSLHRRRSCIFTSDLNVTR